MGVKGLDQRPNRCTGAGTAHLPGPSHVPPPVGYLLPPRRGDSGRLGETRGDSGRLGETRGDSERQSSLAAGSIPPPTAPDEPVGALHGSQSPLTKTKKTKIFVQLYKWQPFRLKYKIHSKLKMERQVKAEGSHAPLLSGSSSGIPTPVEIDFLALLNVNL